MKQLLSLVFFLTLFLDLFSQCCYITANQISPCTGQSASYTCCTSGNPSNATYTWIVSGGGGTITAGQGTPNITVYYSGTGLVSIDCIVSVGGSTICWGVGGFQDNVWAPSPVPVYGPGITATDGCLYEYTCIWQHGYTAATYNGYYNVNPAYGTIVSLTQNLGVSSGFSYDTLLIQWHTAGNTSVDFSYVHAMTGCSSFSSLPVTINSSPVFQTPSITGDTSVIAGDSVWYYVPFMSGYTYTWAVQNGNIIYGQGTDSIQVQWNSGTNGTVSYTLSNGACSGAGSQNIDIVPYSIIGLSSTCYNNSYSYYFKPYSSVATYTWQLSGGSIVSGGNSDTVTVNWNSPGIYQLSVLVNDTSGIWYDTILVTNTAPQFSLGNDTTICSGDSIQISAPSGHALYNWSTGATSTAISFTSPGTVSVQVIDTNGCSTSDTLLINGSQPVSALGNDTSICANDSILLLAGPSGQSYIWSNADTLSSTYITAAGYYWVDISDSIGCVIRDSILINTNMLNPVTLPPDTVICASDTINISASIGQLSYLWNTGDTNNFLQISIPGTYWVQGLDTNGCETSDTISIPLNICVWPGDANADQVVDNTDVLAIGVGAGTTGTLRPGASLTWIEQSCSPWNDTLASGTNYAHIDCDGNGIINVSDTQAVSINYGNVHNKGNGIAGIIPIQVVATQDTFYPGDTVHFSIDLGYNWLPVDSIYGIALSLNVSATVMKPNSLTFYPDPCWMGIPGSNAILFSKSFQASGYCDLAFVRLDQQNVSGSGPIIFGSFVVDVNSQTNINQTISISGIEGVLSDGQATAGFSAGFDQIFISDILNNIEPGIKEVPVVFPNPASDQLQVSWKGYSFAAVITDVLGKCLFTGSLTNSGVIDISEIPSGMYYLRLVNGKNIFVEKIFISR